MHLFMASRTLGQKPFCRQCKWVVPLRSIQAEPELRKRVFAILEELLPERAGADGFPEKNLFSQG